LIFKDSLFFVHIPKTAGTSFRVALAGALGQEAVICDYGASVPETSECVREYVFARQDHYGLFSVLAADGRRFCITGHVPVKKYAAFFEARNILLFLRDPVQRVLSNYSQFCRVNGYTGTLEAFCQEPRHINRQSQFLGKYPLPLVGLAGIQEQYAESLTLLAHTQGLALQEMGLNVNGEGDSRERETPDASVLALIRRLNGKDISLYRQGQALLAQRLALLAQGMPWTYGQVKQLRPASVTGYAQPEQGDDAVRVAVYRNGTQVAEVAATRYRPGLREYNVARNGFIGFDHAFDTPLEPDERVECRVFDTGQVLSGPMTIRPGGG